MCNMVTECDVTKSQNLREELLHEGTLTLLTSSSKVFYMHRNLLNITGNEKIKYVTFLFLKSKEYLS